MTYLYYLTVLSTKNYGKQKSKLVTINKVLYPKYSNSSEELESEPIQR